MPYANRFVKIIESAEDGKTMKKFEGYYFRHQNEKNTVAVIVGTASDSSFVQIITDELSEIYTFRPNDCLTEPGKSKKRKSTGLWNNIRIGNNTFSKDGITLDLPDVTGDIRYTGLCGLRSDIMGFFRFFPMECRHTVVSMRHRLEGSLTVKGKTYDFNGGTGYIEGDSGTSFPKKYTWVQANNYGNGSFMLAVADIPFAFFDFRGVICAIVSNGKEYRLATYLGAKITEEGNTITVIQRSLKLQCEIIDPGKGFPLASPLCGKMCGNVGEHNGATVNVCLTENGIPIFSFLTDRAGYEKYPEDIL